MVRHSEDLRPLSFETGVQIHAAGSCLVKLGNTHVLCAATLEEGVPPFLRGQGRGWLTAEYGMLPGATNTRAAREVRKGRPEGRTVEIQRLIGRSLRQAVDLKALGERQLLLDCDVINADGGTRCAAITGAWVALTLALRQAGLEAALVRQVSAVSVGLLPEVADGAPLRRVGRVLDLEYEEDHCADVDSNVVASRPMAGGPLELVEFQATSEGRSCSREAMIALMDLGLLGCGQLMDRQRLVLE